MEGYEVEHEFPGLGHHTLLLNARQVFYEGRRQHHHSSTASRMLPPQRVLEREKDELLRQFEEARAFAQAIVDTVRRPFLGARPGPPRARREPLILLDIRGQPRRTPRAGFFTRWATVNGTFHG